MAEKEYIEKAALEKFIQDGLNNPDKLKAFGYDAIEILAEIHYTPPADVVEVVHGEWVRTTDIEGITQMQCSMCGMTKYGRCKTNYCSRCGAKMDSGSMVV